MNIVKLPTEILIIIFKKLDLISLFNLYTTSDRIRLIIVQYVSVQRCDLSLSTLSTAKTLKTTFFKDISVNIQELNLCGITDLNKKLLTSALSRITNLKSLNISYTNIDILDFIEIYEGCQRITTICINFLFSNKVKLSKKSLLQCQEVFKNFENVYFIGSASNLLYSLLPLFILYKSKLKTLEYTIIENEMITYESVECDKIMQFDNFFLNIFNGMSSRRYHILELPLFNMLNDRHHEIIIICNLNEPRSFVFVTPLFKPFFEDNFTLHIQNVTSFGVVLSGSACMMIWRKGCTEFNQIFYKNLYERLKCLVPFYFKSNSTPSCKNHDWYITTPTQETEIYSSYAKEIGFKKQRNVHPNHVLNYDEQFEEKQQLQLSLIFNGDIKSGVTLSTSSNYLRKLTYLNLCGVVRYSGDFFNLLFRCCSQLLTFNIEVPPICSCFSSIAKSIPLSQSLKNIRILDRRMDYKLLFSSMSLCKRLENVILCDMSLDTLNLSDPYVMFHNCNHLYCLYVYGTMTGTARLKNLKLLKNAKTKCQKIYLKINLFSKKEFQQYYDPYLAAFKLNVTLC